jgi:hypothetical protein
MFIIFKKKWHMNILYLIGYNVCEKEFSKCNNEELYHFGQFLAYVKVHKTFMWHSNDL